MLNRLVTALCVLVLGLGFAAPTIPVAHPPPTVPEMRLTVVRDPGLSGLPSLHIVVMNPKVAELLARLRALPPEPARGGHSIECGLEQGLTYQLTFTATTNQVFHAATLACGSLGIMADDHIAHAPDKAFWRFFQATIGQPVLPAWINLNDVP